MSSIFDNMLAERIKEEMGKSGLNQAALARRAGVSTAVISALLTGFSKSMSVENLVRVAQVLNVSVEYLVTGKKREPRASLTPREEAMIAAFRELPDADKDRVHTVATAFAGQTNLGAKLKTGEE